MVADWLTRLEGRLAEGGEDELAVALVALAYAAGEDIGVPDPELRAAGRRALLLLAAGGDPARGLALEGRAVAALAADLDDEQRRTALLAGLDELLIKAHGYPHVSEALRALADDADLAWRAYAAALLAEELESDLGDD
jgi:hypothetical protein